MEDFAADAVSFLDALDIERAIVAGHSGSCLSGASDGPPNGWTKATCRSDPTTQGDAY